MSRWLTLFLALLALSCGSAGQKGPAELERRNFWDVCDYKPACECGPACEGKPVQVVTGDAHACVRYDTGGVMCWGLSRGSETDPSVFRADRGLYASPGLGNRPSAMPPEGIDDAIDIAAGTWHTCVLRRDRTVWCWGRNDVGQLGIDEELDSHVEHKTPAMVADLEEVSDISAGDNGTCGVTEKDLFFTVMGWPWPDETVPSLACSNLGGSYCQLTTAGTVFCWGRDEYGDLGDGEPSLSTANSHHIPPEVLSDVVAIDSGYHSSCALRKNGELWCWGDNGDGAIGNGQVSRTAELPQKVAGIGGRVIDFAVNTYTACAVREDGQLLCWGEDAIGIMGSEERFKDVPTPTAIANASDIVDVDIYSATGCVIRRSGQVACWGGDTFGETGPERRYMPVNDLQPVRGLPGQGQTPVVDRPDEDDPSTPELE